jgi:arsenate reductase
MPDLTVFHNSTCTTSQHVLTDLTDAGHDVEVVQYLKTPLDKAQLLELMDKLEDPPEDLVRKDAFFTSQRLRAEDYKTADEVADLLVEHPRLMQRPVIVKGDRAIIGRPRDRVLPFVAS